MRNMQFSMVINYDLLINFLIRSILRLLSMVSLQPQRRRRRISLCMQGKGHSLKPCSPRKYGLFFSHEIETRFQRTAGNHVQTQRPLVTSYNACDDQFNVSGLSKTRGSVVSSDKYVSCSTKRINKR